MLLPNTYYHDWSPATSSLLTLASSSLELLVFPIFFNPISTRFSQDTLTLTLPRPRPRHASPAHHSYSQRRQSPKLSISLETLWTFVAWSSSRKQAEAEAEQNATSSPSLLYFSLLFSLNYFYLSTLYIVHQPSPIASSTRAAISFRLL